MNSSKTKIDGKTVRLWKIVAVWEWHFRKTELRKNHLLESISKVFLDSLVSSYCIGGYSLIERSTGNDTRDSSKAWLICFPQKSWKKTLFLHIDTYNFLCGVWSVFVGWHARLDSKRLTKRRRRRATASSLVCFDCGGELRVESETFSEGSTAVLSYIFPSYFIYKYTNIPTFLRTHYGKWNLFSRLGSR